MMRIAEDSDAVFAQAIEWGVLSEDAGDANFAGHYMYMFHDADGAAWFKHHDTRAYVTMGVAPGKGLAPRQGGCTWQPGCTLPRACGRQRTR